MFVTWVTVVFVGEGSVTYNVTSVQNRTVAAEMTPVTHYDHKNTSIFRTSYVFRATMDNLQPDTTYGTLPVTF